MYVDNKSVMHLSNKLKSFLNAVPEIQCRGNDYKRVTGKFSGCKISHFQKLMNSWFKKGLKDTCHRI